MTKNPQSPMDPSVSLARLATTWSGAARVFHRHRLDYCCRGERSLAEASAERGLDPILILAEIASESTKPEPFARCDELPPAELADHIERRFHHRHREELARLGQLAAKVEQVHAGHEECPRELHGHLAEFERELQVHMAEEEQVLFPIIRQGGGERLAAAIPRLVHEHERYAARLARTRELTRDFTPPSGACGTWRALYLGLEELEQELMRHVHLENHVLFPGALGR